ncbi:MAG: Maf family protein [Chloroflexota bacterium]
MTRKNPSNYCNLVLASASPRRRELLKILGVPFAVVTSSVNEQSFNHCDPEDMVIKLARLKAEMQTDQLNNTDAVVIGADTIVVHQSSVLGKPRSNAEAVDMLERLAGEFHHVHTGLAVHFPDTGITLELRATTIVRMREFTRQEAKDYVASGDPMDKAGSYAIQNQVFAPVESIQGCYANVVGLPLCHLYLLLREHCDIDSRVPERCQAALQIECHEHPQILKNRNVVGVAE